ncbi:hypothetical protein H2202_009805 [Exophiala xenobiotica]|nr:hypothetical protein H2202_009805 [Exophiala xenobiotica]KAK5212102.1 hypothetical protein LTR41_002344 [Exophiala xenobiotica]KAK5235196.1 hypothetical protein LTR47_004032 [Exophiala xenobiotica]KAK5249868.1 hypothetical protein LTS06_005223 [Exophiala xenobiotica]KAK5279560.1 hypothetical protein LTR40_007621 [Exophiala xenobiotica]
MSKPVVVIVPGAWHRPQHYQKLIEKLQEHQYEAVGVPLPSVDAKPPLPSWEKDAQAIRDVVLKNLDAGKDVITIAHSYGGVPMGEAVKGLGKKAREEQGFKTGVTRLIYMCAVALKEGQTFQDASKPVTEEEIQAAMRQMQAVKIEEDGTMVAGDKDLGRELLYNRCDPKDVDVALELVGTHSVGTLVVPATTTAFKEIPSTYILTENDRALPPTIQERIIAAGEGAFDVVRCQEGHAPYLSNPAFIADCIRRAAGENI